MKTTPLSFIKLGSKAEVLDCRSRSFYEKEITLIIFTVSGFSQHLISFVFLARHKKPVALTYFSAEAYDASNQDTVLLIFFLGFSKPSDTNDPENFISNALLEP